MNDRQRWDGRHARGDAPGPPSTFVARHVSTLASTSRGGRAMDLACGSGRHSALLAEAGFRAVAVDFSLKAVTSVRRRTPKVAGVVADARSLPFPPASFDLIVVTLFLLREIFPTLLRLLRRDGVLLAETFLRAEYERTGHPRPEFCLEPGELRRLCTPQGVGVDLIEYIESDHEAAKKQPALASAAVRYT